MDDFTGNRPGKTFGRVPNVAEPTILWIEAASKGMREAGQETERFLGERAKRNLDTWAEIVQCAASPSKVMQLHQEWLTDTIRDCTEQRRRMMTITYEMMQDFFNGTRKPSEPASFPVATSAKR